MAAPDHRDPREADVHLERDVFLRTLLHHLAGALEEVVGVRDASGFVSIVGQRMGDELGAEYRRALGVEQLPPEQLGAVLVDLKRRIGGEFRVIEQTEDRIVFAARSCPFGDKVVGRPSLCMMTSNVFGSIAADSTGFAKVGLEQAIARGDAGCRVVVYLRPSERAAAATGREYVRG
ncbi:methanogen output domain 1-containing protein [Anaeromyxobacter terrae]|uniref:methanogen output domain 1-containing protein n=1 Tax=Anaeromyxobacter terrae TaxID=2925406 RepID=UPI001F596A54|nr:methanogen output domain 1-containing protein [Anaeromyxobacter sp. SG22]